MYIKNWRAWRYTKHTRRYSWLTEAAYKYTVGLNLRQTNTGRE